MRVSLSASFVLALASCKAGDRPPAATLVLWAWERPEDLRFAGADVEIAVQTGFVEILGNDYRARGRRFPLKTMRRPETALVHVEINHAQPLHWTPALRARVGSAVLHYATLLPVRRVQIDFEVRASERAMLLDLLRDVRQRLPRGTRLSMTALASWCDTEDWLNEAPVDEIVPMLFRMQPRGEGIVRRLAAGGDLRNRRCRAAFGISTDTPLGRAPAGRRVYLFNPRSWTAESFAAARRQVEGWR